MKRKLKNIFKRVIATACAALMVLGSLFSNIGTINAQAAGEHTLWIVGDSTVCAFSETKYYPRYGYGTQIGNYLDGTYTVQNLAVSGTSSKSFTSHQNYSTLTSGIKEGDTLLVGFGHNDEKAEDAARYTSPTGDYTTEGSFAKSLYDNYITMAKNAGAEIILCTPIVRRTAGDTWSDSQLHVTNGGDYAQVIRDLGAAVNVPVVDLTALTKNLYDSLGADETVYLHAWSNSDPGSVDNTHLNIYGAKQVAWLFANAVDDTTATLASSITLTAGEPTKANDLVVDPNYVESDYSNDLAQSTLWPDYVIGEGDSAVAFKGTAFGELGGKPTTSNYTLEKDANGNMHMVALNNKGKITSSNDGIIMYYYKVPVGSSFSLSATATVNSFDTNKQVAFGLMARDDMYIDVNDATVGTADYVAAATLGSGCNCFYRKSGSLGGRAALATETLAAGSSYDLSIVSNADGYTCTFGKETPQSAGYDFPLNTVDSEYVYIGMFVARNADITYSNIKLVVDGETIASTIKPEYNITVSGGENGTAKADVATAIEGATVALTATPNAGYYFKEWQVVSGDITIENDSFVMPAGNVEVKAVFEEYRTAWDFVNDATLLGADNGIKLQGQAQNFAGLTIDATASGAKFDSYSRTSYAQTNAGTVIVVPVQGPSKVTVTSYSAGTFSVDGQQATKVSETFICEGKDNKVTITYTANDYLASISVVPYVQVEEGTVNFKTTNLADAKGYSAASVIDSGSGHGLQTKATDATITLSLAKNANVVVTACCFGAGTAGTMTASSGDVSFVEVEEGDKKGLVFTVTAAQAGEFTLTFASNMYIHDITVEYVEVVSGNSITVTTEGNGVAKANVATAEEGATVILTATPDAGYYFKEWKVVNGNVTITDNSFVMPAGGVEIQAVFEAYRKEWDFVKDTSLLGTENGAVIQGKIQSFAGLTVDATASGAKFDSYNRTSYAQTNAGTIITVPVEGSCKVTVTSYTAGTFTVDGKAATGVSETFICEGKDNKVTIAYTAHDYLASIKVVPYAEVAGGKINFANSVSTDTWKGIAMVNVGGVNNSHGLHTSADNATMTLTLADKANIIVTTCRYGAGLKGTMTASSGKVSMVEVDEYGANAPVFTVMGAEAGDVTLTFANDVYIHDITVEYMVEVGPRNIDVWDMGGLVEADTDTYTSHITPEGYIAAGVNKTFPGNVEVGDLTIVANKGSDRLYTTVGALANYTYGTFGAASKDYGDGYVAAGCFYTNGTGGASRRYLTIANVQAGDKIVLYGGIHGGSDTQFIFEGQGTASAQKDVVEIKSSEYKKFEFVAEYTGTYKIWENGAGKALYHRVVRVPGVAVSGTINVAEGENQYTGTEHSVKFINDTTKQETLAVLDGNTFTATLAPGYSYTAVLMDVVGYGFTAESRTITTTDAEALTGKAGVELVIEPKALYSYTGKITGFAEGYDVSKLVVTMVPPADSTLLATDLTIDADLNFSVSLEPDAVYTIRLTGVNDYEVKSDLVINKGENYNANIEVGLKPMYQVNGGFIGLSEGATVSALSFVNVEDNYTYTATVTADGYSISLRDGSYQAKATIDGYRTITHVVVDGAAVSKDLMFASTTAAPAAEWVSDIYVGYPDKENNYNTVSEAVAACAAMNPTKEEQRITVHIAPGTYREQVIVSAPYVSFVNDTDEEVLLTWYYGIGYQYYSIDATGYYNPENAYDKFGKKGPADWGAAVFIKPSATAFRAEGITFENSFNRYITDEELADGVEPSGAEAIDVERKYGVDVQSKAATERAAAVVIKADKAEFKDCAFYSSQDTLFTGNAAYNVYFKNCFIEGQTDYIYGDGNAIFDACELSFKGYSANSQGGYITAARPTSVNGYLFRNCIVTANDELTVVPGYFGRPWGADAKVMFVNTRLESADLIAAAGWYKMTGEPEDANFYEFNTTDMNGNAVNTSSRRGKIADEVTAAGWTLEYIYGNWVPAFYEAEEATVAFATAPFVTDNGDINTPYPGHTLTVGYSLGEANDANDASRIEWYRVKEGAADVLVKTSYASVDKTYKIASEDIGYQIKVVVTPMTVSGNVGEAANYTVPESVRDGYDDPDASGSDAILGDGVNVFLIGDSTVKDYSAAGIWSGGKAREEGAWGEFFQSFFDKEKVTIVNYANGGRSTRNFINEGSLDLVAEKIGEGDYMFIQFGHNDCSNGAGYLADRYVPLGEPDANGVYPVTAGTKVATPKELDGKGYGSECYTYDCGGTFKWYLMQYIEVAKNAGAIPVLVTPVSRMYYTSNGTIKTHHDSTDTTTGTQVTSNNAYVTAVKQLAQEQDILLVDGFELTKKLFEDAYAAGGNDVYGTQIMHTGDKTHNNKLGGMIEAAVIASAVQNMELNISYAVKTPAQVLGETTSGKTVFSVNGSGVITAYDINSEYVDRAPYWEGVGQTIIDAIGVKAEELAKQDGGNESGTEKTWSFSAFGQSVDTKNNVLIDGIDGKEDTSLALKSENKKGKLVPANTDGLAFYYTTINPATENFTLSADITVDSWTLSNGQEGFGIMAADAVGEHGNSSVFWNNSYMALVSKVEYLWNEETKKVDTAGSKYTMKLGVGSQEKTGVTPDNLEEIKAGNLSAFHTSMKTLETSMAEAGKAAGSYNIVGNYTNDDSAMNSEKKVTTFHLSIQRNNTGYLISYTDENGKTTSNLYYHGEDGDALTKLDSNNIYVGFFASRNAAITVNNVKLTTINPADDEVAEDRPVSYVSAGCTIESADITNTAEYELVYYGKADGKLTISHSDTVYVQDAEVKAGKKYRAMIPMQVGEQKEITVAFTPNPDYAPSEHERLDSYETSYLTKTVTYGAFERDVIYVAPDGNGTEGTKEAPMSIYDAVKFVKPGNVILMKGGTYNLNRTLFIERGINGTEEHPIYLIADPDAADRPVLDFGKNCAGMVLAGDYWYLQGFDVTKSAPGQKGIQVSGSYNVVDDIHAYRNGNTGIQISRYMTSDTWEDWPSNNLILNCTSYLNADPGYEDADGFAAKLTVAEGNVFDGCIAAYNADDGWDLFAKIETGPIGKVVIKNSVAFKNGYDIDENGNEINAGNGNGFKMGGSSISGKHVLENSVAFANKAKGIDSNSGPDIQVINSTSFDNESYNVAFYTNDVANTDFSAEGIISFKVANAVADSLKLKGTQDDSKVYKDSNYYCFGEESKNHSGEKVASDWFVNLDTAAAIRGGITRNADGTINMNGYLELTETAVDALKAGNAVVIGARISGAGVIENSMTASPEIEIPGLGTEDDDDAENDGSGEDVPVTPPSEEPEIPWWADEEEEVAEPAATPAPVQTVIHVVQKGETLWSLARKYGCSVEEIVATNSGLVKDKNVIQVGWPLTIPVGGTGASQGNIPQGGTSQGGSDVSKGDEQTTVLPNVRPERYVVKKGDSLWKIAQANDCTVKEIVLLNQDLIKNPQLIYAGWELKLPEKKKD